jgi:acyl-CoA:acyl-CoA alkyltransferase
MGAETRYIRDTTNGERALDLILKAIGTALQEAEVSAPEIDLIIYCGVGRGFLEPANAAFVSKALGTRCECFDVAEACLSWVRSLHIAHSLIRAGSYNRILVVNGEFNAHESRIDKALRFSSADQLRYTFPMLTIGEAATATLLTASSSKWSFKFLSDPRLADLCTLPLPGFEEFAEPSPRLGLNGAYQLVSFGQELSQEAVSTLIAFVRSNVANPCAVDHWFPHAAAESLCTFAGETLGLGTRLHSDVFRRYGNLVSASIPVGVHMALATGSLSRGQRVILCPASAGASFAVADFTF